MFYGKYRHKIDSKGRVALPARLRTAGKGLGYTEFVLTRGIGGCIALFPANKFEEFINNFDASELSFEESLAFYREFASWAHFVAIDNQGRILLPSVLKEEAGIKDDVLILGVVDWIEIWNPDRYSAYTKSQKVDYDSGAMKFFGSLIRGRRAKTGGENPQERIS
ncbi:cell division/cell wall cluster transcriptional repressor MraZ [bacterium]|nr:division/cell wall cluster transcriptional repressor MraZ [bacterium]RKZ32403.1 MAG: cell division/cell wall cluster transcriptional repressor MraZ [bacterium]